MGLKMYKKRYYPWLLVALLWVIALLNYMDRQMIATMRPSMQLDIKELEQAANFGRLMAVFLWVYGILSVFTGIVADKVNRKWLIIASLFIWSVVTFAMGYAKTFEQLYWLRALMGFSEAFYIPAGLAMIADFHSDRTRSLAVGIHLSGVYMGQALGGFGSTISKLYSWQQTFMLFGLIGIVYAVVLVFALHDNRRRGDVETQKNLIQFLPFGFFHGLFRLFRSWPFWIIVLYFTVPSLPGWAMKNWAPTLIADKLHMDMAKAGPLTTMAISIASLAGVILGGYISDLWVSKHIRGRIFTGVFGLFLTIPALMLLGNATSMLSIMTAAICFGLGFGIFDCNNMPIICQFVPVDQRATAYGFLNTVGICSGALITDYLGRSTDAGNLAGAFSKLAGAVGLVLMVQLIFLRPKQMERGV
jgi:MFS transporter, ACS family, D-galactonate transporter